MGKITEAVWYRVWDASVPGDGNPPRCRKGHALTVDNTYLSPEGLTRKCRECERGWGKAHRNRKRLAQWAKDLT